MNISLLNKKEWTHEDLVELLNLHDESEEEMALLKKAHFVKEKLFGKKVFLRGLIEFSNYCQKNCLYCGIRKDNTLSRYKMSEEEIISKCFEAYNSGYEAVVLQSGENNSSSFIQTLLNVLQKIPSDLAVTLSMGEYSLEVYQELKKANAKRYLLRIESSSKEIYEKIHPQNSLHSFDTRLEALKNIQRAHFQTGTGVMIGLPFQTISDLAHDLLFFKEFDIDMVGMGPYLEHSNTPLYDYKETLLPQKARLHLSLRMIALLRCMMPHINIASATSLETIHPEGRFLALNAGANVVMLNITPEHLRSNYELYQNKPKTTSHPKLLRENFQKKLSSYGLTL